MLRATLLMLCTQARDCHPDRREGTQNCSEEEEIFRCAQYDKSVGGVITFGPYGRCHSLQCHPERSEVSLIFYRSFQP